MSTVLLLVLLFISIILTGLILIQQSEGGALGIGGGGGGGGGLMSGRSAANSVSRMTGILGAAFLIFSLALSIVFNKENETTSILDEANAEAPLTEVVDSVEDTLPLVDSNEAASSGDETVISETTETPTPDATEDESETPKQPERE